MVKIDGTYEGDLRCVAVHAPSGAELLTDAPVDHEGLGRSFSPTDLIATALATCVVTILGLVARRRGLSIEGSRWSITKEMVADPKRRVGRLALSITLPAELPERDRRALQTAGDTCPVKQSMDPRTDVEIEYRYE
jgi:putative redox protein